MDTDLENTEAFVDTSVWIAIILEEDGYRAQADRLGVPAALWIAAPVLAEALLVLERRRIPNGVAQFQRLMQISEARVFAFYESQARLAHEAYRRYGKGRHPAALNFGDCLSYAAAKSRGARLLYAGDDFSQIDLA